MAIGDQQVRTREAAPPPAAAPRPPGEPAPLRGAAVPTGPSARADLPLAATLQRAVLQRIQDPERVDWSTATNIGASSAGALGGVVFMTVGSEMYAIKPGEGSAANPLFAEEVLSRIGGAQTTESRPVRAGAGPFDEILKKIRAARLAAQQGSPARARWDDLLPFYLRASFFLVQKSMKSNDLGGMGNDDFSATYKTQPMKILRDHEFLVSVGRTLVADLLLGNADRLEAINGGNFFVLGTHRVGAIDNETFMPSMRVTAHHFTTGRGQADLGQNAAQASLEENWVDYLIEGGSAVHKPAPVSRLPTIDDIDRWIRVSFLSVFSKYAHPVNEPVEHAQDMARMQAMNAAGFPIQPGAAPSHAELMNEYKAVRDAIVEGFAEGLAALEQHLTGSGGKKLRAKFRDLEEEHGREHTGMDFGAFEVRAAYLMARRSNQNHQAARAAALAVARGLVSDHATRVIASARQANILSAGDEVVLRAALSELPFDKQDELVHVRPGVRKQLSKIPLFGSKDKWESSFETLRGKLLKKFVDDIAQEDPMTTSVAASNAYRAAVAEAEAIHKVFLKHSPDETAFAGAVWGRYAIPKPA